MTIATDQLTGTPTAASAETRSAGDRTPRRSVVALALWLAGSWALVLLADVLSADAVLPIVLLVAVAAVLRTGRTLVDRLMFAGFSLAGALMIGGLLFSLWPWGLSPAPVAGVLLSAVVGLAWLCRRAPRLPRRVDLTDLVVVGTGLFALGAALRPLLREPYLERFALLTTSEDRSQHFAIFDTIHRLGGYLFFHQDASRQVLLSPTESAYPTGSHYLYAVIDTFVRSATDPGSAIASFNRYFLLVLVGHALLVTGIVWAARWVLRPLVSGWRLLLAVSAVGAVVLSGWPMTLVAAGFDSEVFGLACMAFVVAVTVRPATDVMDRIWLIGAGLVLITYSYYLFLPFAVLAVAATLFIHRRQVRQRLRAHLIGAGLFAAVIGVPLVFLATSSLSVGTQALAGGHAVEPPRAGLAAITVCLVALLASTSIRRSRPARIWSLQMAGGVAFIGAFGLYQAIKIGGTSYYFEKLTTCFLLMGMIGVVLLAVHLAPGPAVVGRTRRSAGLAHVLGLSLSAALLFSIAGFEPGLKPSTVLGGRWAASPLGAWYHGHTISPVGADLADLAGRGLLADGVTTIFLVQNSGYLNWRITFANATLNRDSGPLVPMINKVLPIEAGGAPLADPELARAVELVREAVLTQGTPVRVVVRDADTAEALTEALDDLPATVLKLS